MNAASGLPIRNVAVVSSVGTGKTTLVEALLFAAGVIPAMGSVGQGTTVTDFEPDEQHRRHSLQTAVVHCVWKDTRITLLDTPGDRNFLGDTLAALRVADAVLLVVSGVSGARPDLGRLWAQLSATRLPVILFVTDLDKEGASFEAALASCRERMEGSTIVPCTVPGGRTALGEAVVDLLAQRLVVSNPTTPTPQILPIPAPIAELAAATRRPLLEAVAETDDARLEEYLATGELAADAVRHGLAQAMRKGLLVPAFGGSGLQYVGVTVLLDAIVTCAPSPAERAGMDGWIGRDPRTGAAISRSPDPVAPCVALVFKTIIDPFMGSLNYVRVYSGTLVADRPVFNATTSAQERGGHLFTMIGKKYLPVASLAAGQIGAIARLKDTHTGDTLCEEQAPMVLAPPVFPRSVLSVALAPKSKADIEKVSLGLHKLVEEDPTLHVTRQEDTHELVLSGLGELHLDVAVERLRRKYGVEVVLHPPRVPYKETIASSATAQGKYKKQTGGHGQYGDCWLRISPLPHGKGFVFENNVVGGAIPRNFIPAVEKGVVEAMRAGCLAGYPVVDVQVSVYDGSYHSVDSSELAFKMAGALAFRQALESAHPVLLEPLMLVTVTCPDDTVGAVIGDLNARRGRITAVTTEGHSERIEAMVPMAELVTYAPVLNGLTGGRGDYAMEFSAYEQVPRELVGKLVDEARAGKSTAAAT